eukprot:754329-Amphidinium_carterae.1
MCASCSRAEARSCGCVHKKEWNRVPFVVLPVSILPTKCSSADWTCEVEVDREAVLLAALTQPVLLTTISQEDALQSRHAM